MSSVSFPVLVGREGGFWRGGCLLSWVRVFTPCCCEPPVLQGGLTLQSWGRSVVFQQEPPMRYHSGAKLERKLL